MNKRLILTLTLAFVVGLFFNAYAEVQNVKVGGDILMQGVSRDDFRLKAGSTANERDYRESFISSQVRVKVDADLTDNVSTTMRLINERLWGEQNSVNTATNNTNNIDIDLAYITLKEFLYSPLTLTLGRQEIFFGKGLIIADGTNYYDFSTTKASNVPNDLSLRKAFDAIRATLNYDPLMVDLIYAKAEENTRNVSDDVDVAGLNAHYVIDNKTSVDGYFYAKNDKNGLGKKEKFYTIGALLAVNPIEKLMTSLEFAYQFGAFRSTATDAATRRRAFAIQAMADYMFKTKLDPMVGVAYTYLSGDQSATDNTHAEWDPMFEGQAPNDLTNAIFAGTNVAVFNVYGKLKPKDDLALKANLGLYYLTSKRASFTNIYTGQTLMFNDDKEAGQELDLSATYDYTEDVQMALNWGWFKPGKAFQDANNDATQLIGSMKVAF
ncbi:MAG: alginate export family protein [Candidatus Omnitrophota bacterium]|nr:alginate export family protein [Candidatus Omnitrophota bacterium]